MNEWTNKKTMVEQIWMNKWTNMNEKMNEQIKEQIKKQYKTFYLQLNFYYNSQLQILHIITIF